MTVDDYMKSPVWELEDMEVLTTGRCIDCLEKITICDYTFVNIYTKEIKRFNRVRDKCLCDR